MNPKKAECVGFYLYGSGYYAREDQVMELARGKGVSFCNECPVMKRCEDEHVERVRISHPEEVELFALQLRAAARRNITPLMVEATRLNQGDPDPFMRAAMDNFRMGRRDRLSDGLMG